MIKILHNNLIIDVCVQENYLRYLPNHKRFISVDRNIANAVIGSDNNTIYHLKNTPYTFLDEYKTVEVVEIDEKEYFKLTSQSIVKPKEKNSLASEVNLLKQLVFQQNSLIQQLLSKLN